MCCCRSTLLKGAQFSTLLYCTVLYCTVAEVPVHEVDVQPHPLLYSTVQYSTLLNGAQFSTLLSCPVLLQKYPYMKSMCNPIPSVINGRNCNPPSSGVDSETSGYCSGFSYGDAGRELLVLHPAGLYSPNPLLYCTGL